MFCLLFHEYYLKLIVTYLATMIIKIKMKYKFNKGFDLISKIKGLPSDLVLYTKLIANTPRLSVIKKHLIKLNKISSELRVCLQETPSSAKSYLNETLKNGFESGYGRLMSENNDWIVSRFESDVQAFDNICMYALEGFPGDKGGQVRSSLPKYIIFRLAAIYHLGVQVEPTCGWDEFAGCYVGDFYNFLIELKSFVPCFLGTDFTIGKYATEVLASYKDGLKNGDLMIGCVTS